ncbi:hypothetical protein F4859DRAFT_516649 [Xylaria cf. heliscus]|nr:hypothetical protein F4859DRAFT_516649 [Xylaria cf. heliscus]
MLVKVIVGLSMFIASIKPKAPSAQVLTPAEFIDKKNRDSKLINMKIAAATIVLLATAGSAVAKSCKKNGLYCGQSLINRGNYNDHIIQVLETAGQPTDTAHILNSRFSCGSNGDITFLQFCAKGCSGVGSTDDDYCL